MGNGITIFEPNVVHHQPHTDGAVTRGDGEYELRGSITFKVNYKYNDFYGEFHISDEDEIYDRIRRLVDAEMVAYFKR